MRGAFVGTGGFLFVSGRTDFLAVAGLKNLKFEKPLTKTWWLVQWDALFWHRHLHLLFEQVEQTVFVINTLVKFEPCAGL